MRKIEKEMCQAVRQFRDWKSANTEVRTTQLGSCDVYLHGNHIANVTQDLSTVAVNASTLRHWPTRTTMSRLRALGANVYTLDGMPYIDGQTALAYS